MSPRHFMFAFAICLAVFAVTPTITLSETPAQPNEIRIAVDGLRNQKGSVICSLWASADSSRFTKTGTETYKRSAPIHQDQAVCEFQGLHAGAYAATVFHDENGNGIFDRRFGYPLEGYGFTNNVNPTIKAPSFDQCKFEYDGKGTLALSIAIIYR